MPPQSEQPAPPAIPVPEHETEVASAAPTLESAPESPAEPQPEHEPESPQVDQPPVAPNVERVDPRTEPPGNAVEALMSGKVAVVPVEWLERMLSPAQVQQVIRRRADRVERVDRARSAVHGEPSNPKMKFCPGCSTEKVRAKDFYKMTTGKDGYQPRPAHRSVVSTPVERRTRAVVSS